MAQYCRGHASHWGFRATSVDFGRGNLNMTKPYGGYFVEWACGADLSADTIEARWQVADKTNAQAIA
jgi:hypothetical protein